MVLAACQLQAQSPHGENLRIDCKACHSPQSWAFNADSSTFTHAQTGFALNGQHARTECRSCHQDLKFTKTESVCVSCHTDVHSMTVGDDCVRCHETDNWLVDNIPELHEQNGFPLLNQHRMADCTDCHTSGDNLRWERIGNDCRSCHLPNYQATTEPDHQAAGFSTDCTDCHDPMAQSWGAENFHQFFPLVGGHDISDCFKCHLSNNFGAASPECISCHQDDYNNVTSIDHNTAGFSTECTQCHNTNAWTPAVFTEHDGLYFPIYSGKHNNTWNTCNECHTTPGDYSAFSCIDCHEHSDPAKLANKHKEEPDYVFQSQACFDCHPKGRGGD